MSTVSDQTNPRKLVASTAYVKLLTDRDDANKVAEAVANAAPADLETGVTKATADIAFKLDGKAITSPTFSKYAALYVVKNIKTTAPEIMDMITADILAQKTEAEIEMGLNGLTTTPIVPEGPSITSPATANAVTTQAFVYQIMADNISGPGINGTTYSIANAPTWMKVDAKTGQVTGIPQMVDVGDNTFDAIVTTNIASDKLTVTVTVTPHSKAVVVPGQTLSGTQNVALSYKVQGQYATVGADGVTTAEWSATGLPEGLSIDQATGTISGTPVAASSDAIQVTLTNDFGSDTESVAVNIVSA